MKAPKPAKPPAEVAEALFLAIIGLALATPAKPVLLPMAAVVECDPKIGALLLMEVVMPLPNIGAVVLPNVGVAAPKAEVAPKVAPNVFVKEVEPKVFVEEVEPKVFVVEVELKGFAGALGAPKAGAVPKEAVEPKAGVDPKVALVLLDPNVLVGAVVDPKVLVVEPKEEVAPKVGAAVLPPATVNEEPNGLKAAFSWVAVLVDRNGFAGVLAVVLVV